jgi:hypothetical protein
VVGTYGHGSWGDDAAVSRNDELQVVGDSLDGGGAVVLEADMRRRGWWSTIRTLPLRKTVRARRRSFVYFMATCTTSSTGGSDVGVLLALIPGSDDGVLVPSHGVEWYGMAVWLLRFWSCLCLWTRHR